MVCLNPRYRLRQPLCAILVPMLFLATGCANGRMNLNILHIPETPILEVSGPLGTIKVRIVGFQFEKATEDAKPTANDN